ncbi:MAG: hypothetical protein M1546_13800 [Chloroflexi bacterium]|nr:hypothetical protein [Chloroflexota bacterium]
MSERSENQQSERVPSDIAAEMNRLGENLGKLFKATLESDERKSIEREIRNGLDQLSKQVNSAIDQARHDQSVRKAKDTIKDAWETAHGPQVLNEMRLGLVDSLKKLNDELARRAEPKPAQEVKANVPAETPVAPTVVVSTEIPPQNAPGNPVTNPIDEVKPE